MPPKRGTSSEQNQSASKRKLPTSTVSKPAKEEKEIKTAVMHEVASSSPISIDLTNLEKNENLRKGTNFTKQNDTIAMTFGRFQPPTLGHGVLINKINEHDANVDKYVFISPSHNGDEIRLSKYKNPKKRMVENKVFENLDINKYPLNCYQRTYYLSLMFPKTNFINSLEHNIKDPRTLLWNLIEKYKYQKIYFYCGSDQKLNYNKMVNGVKGDLKKNLIEANKKDIDINMYDNIEVHVIVVGGERQEKGKLTSKNATEELTGTKMRLAAVEGKFNLFKLGLMHDDEYVGDMTEEFAFNMFNDVRNGLNTKLEALTWETINFSGGGKKRVNPKSKAKREKVQSKRPSLNIKAKSIVKRTKVPKSFV